MALLREAGFDVDAVDLTGSGIDSTDSNSIISFAQYVKPLVDFIENLSEGQKVLSKFQLNTGIRLLNASPNTKF